MCHTKQEDVVNQSQHPSSQYDGLPDENNVFFE